MMDQLKHDRMLTRDHPGRHHRKSHWVQMDIYDGGNRVWNNSLDRFKSNLALIMPNCSQEVPLLDEIMRQSAPFQIHGQVMKQIYQEAKWRLNFRRSGFLQVV